MHSEQDSQGAAPAGRLAPQGTRSPGSPACPSRRGPSSPTGPWSRELAFVLRELVPPSPDPDAAAIEIVTCGLDPELRAAADADLHGTVLPRDGITFAELDDLVASLVALAVHTATAAADRCGSTAQEIVAAAALRLRSV